MEQKHIDRRNLLVIGAVILLIVIVAIVAASQKRELNPTLGTLAADPTATPAVTEAATAIPEATAVLESAESTDAPEFPREPAQAYLVVTVAGAMYEPIPLDGEARYTIKRGDMVNVIEVTPNSIKMHESSCENQDCVEQGVVTLENRSLRVLQNMIICLPNEVVLEIYTPDEIAQLLLSMVGYTGEEADE